MHKYARMCFARGAAIAGLLAALSCSSDALELSVEREESDAGEPCRLDRQVWALEDEPLVVPLACASGAALPKHVTIRGLPEGAELDRETAELRWTPALDQAGDHVVELRFGKRERGVVRIGVADRFEHPDNAPIVDPQRYTHEFGLPVFHLNVGPELNDDAHTPATLFYRGKQLGGASAKYRGATSSSYPKRSFTFKFDKDAPFSDEEHGFPAVRRIVLTTNFDDLSGLRQRLSFALWNKLSAEHIQVRSFSAVLYLDGHYLGLYQVTDHVDDDLLREAGMAPDINLYKGRTHSANFRPTDDMGRIKRIMHAGYTKEAGLPEEGSDGAYADLDALVDWIANSEPDAFYRDWDQRLARGDFVDWLVFTSLISAGDTTNKNCYLIHDARAEAPDARWRFVPWDFNTSYGQGYYTQRLPAENYDVERYARRNMWFERLLSDPRLREPMLERYREVLRNDALREELLAALDGWSREIERAALRDEVKWRDAFREYWSDRKSFNTHPEEIVYIREWLQTRWRVFAEQLGAAR